QKLFLSTAFIIALTYQLKAEEFIDSEAPDQEIIQEDAPSVLPSDSYGTPETRIAQLETQVQKLIGKLEVLEHRLKLKNGPVAAPLASLPEKKSQMTLEEDLTPTASDATTLRTDDAQT